MLKKTIIIGYYVEYVRHSLPVGKYSLHVFSDASVNAYASCIFLRSKDSSGKVMVQPLSSKSRVTPTKKTTIPLLELIGCLIGTRLSVAVRNNLNMEGIRCYYWTDSSNALCWIVKTENWSTFVCNRFEEIRIPY